MFFSIYIPMFLFSLYELNNDKSRSLQGEEVNLKVNAAIKGYKPIFYPDKLLQNRNFRFHDVTLGPDSDL